MLNRRALVFSAGKALVSLPVAIASQAYSQKSRTDEISISGGQAAGPIPDQVRCQWLCAGRAAVAPLSRKSSR